MAVTKKILSQYDVKLVTKKCHKCGEVKPVSEFRKASDGKFGVRSTCRSCERLYWLAHREEQNTKAKTRRRAYSLINKSTPQGHDTAKRCGICGAKKPLHDFNKDCTRLDGYCYICKECNKEKDKKYYRSHIDRIREKRETQKGKRAAYDKEYYKKNKEHKLAKSKQWRQTHPEIKRAYNKMYWENNKERLNEQAKAYNRKRKQEDPMYKLKCKVRGMLRDSFRRKGFQKPSPSEEILGCSVEEFQEHLKQTWESKYNTKWDGQPCHIDHVIPLATANTEQEIIRLCHYTNLRLLTPEDNLAKKAKYEQ